MGHIKKIINFIVNIIITLIYIILLSATIMLIIISINTNKNTMELGDFKGYKPIICISNSMKSEFQVGDIIVSKKVAEDEINVGDIITFRKNETIISHRVEQIDYDISGQRKYITKGDSNNTVDELEVTYNDIEGKYYYKIPKIGSLILLLQKPQGYFIAFVIPMGILIICYKHTLERKKIKDLRKRKLLKRLHEQKTLNNNV